MKFSKPVSEAPKKVKTSLTDKPKFKSKGPSSNGSLQKYAKQALNILKTDTNTDDVNKLVKGSLDSKALKNAPGKNQKKKKSNLSPEVKLGLKLDEILKEKAQKSDDSSPETTPKKSKKKKQVQNESSTSQSDSSPKKKQRKRKGKKKNVTLNGSQNVSQTSTDSEVQKSVNPTGSKALKRKMNRSSPDDSPEKIARSPTKKVMDKNSLSAHNKETTKGKKKKKVVSNEDNSKHPETDSSLNDTDFILNPPDVLNAVKATLEVHRKKTSSNKKLLSDEDQPVFLNFLFYQPHPHQKIIRFDLVHSLRTDNSDVCLFVPDLDKKKPDESKALWEETLSKEKCTCISEVIPLKSLMKDYTQFEDKRKLSARFDFFLTDAKISHRVFGCLGNKHFHAKRKTPTPVDLKTGSINNNVEKALKRTVSQYKVAAESFSIQVGHTGMEEKKIQDNVVQVWKQYPQVFGVYWENIRKACLITNVAVELPIFVSLKPPTTVRVFNAMIWKKTRDQPITGELSTAMDRKVKVFSSGKVVVQDEKKVSDGEEKPKKLSKNAKKKQKKKKAEKVVDNTDDDLEGREDMMDSDLDDTIIKDLDLNSEKQEPRGKMNANKKEKKAAGKNKKNKNKKEIKEESSDDESEVDRAEELYLENLAKEKKLTTKKTEATGKGKSGKGKITAQTPTELNSDGDESGDDDVTMDSSAFMNASSDEESFEYADSSDDDEDQEKPKVGGKKKNTKQQNGNVQTQVKNIKNSNKKNPPKEKNVTRKNKKNKPGANKNQQSPKQSKNSSGSNSPSPAGKKKKNSFQGVKADQISKKKNQKKKQLIKNKK